MPLFGHGVKVGGGLEATRRTIVFVLLHSKMFGHVSSPLNFCRTLLHLRDRQGCAES
jgi:hypothetical protein